MTCQWCGSEVYAGAFLCDRCVRALDGVLTNIEGHFTDLDTLRGKRVRYGGATGKGGIGKSQPLPLDGRFADPTGEGSRLEWETRNTVTTWVRVVLDEWPANIAGPVCPVCLHKSCHELRRREPPRDTIAACCRYLNGFRSRIASKTWGPELLDELADLERRLHRFVDRPPARQYLGMCEMCQGSVYAIEGSPTGKCLGCGHEYDTAASRQALTDALDDQLLTAAEIATVSCYLGVPASRERVRNRVNQWHKRDRITPHGRDENGDPRFVYRDVRTLLYADFGSCEHDTRRGA